MNERVPATTTSFWEDNAETPPSNIPLFSKRAQVYSYKKSLEHFFLPSDETIKYEQYLTAILLVLKRYNPNSKIVIGLQLVNKINDQIIPLTFDLKEHGNFKEYEREVKATIESYLPYCSIDFQDIIKLSGTEISSTKNPFFDIVVLETGAFIPPESKHDLTIL